MNLAADQALEQEVDVLPGTKIAECYKAYANIFGHLPPPEEDITVEQLTARHVLLQSGQPLLGLGGLRNSQIRLLGLGSLLNSQACPHLIASHCLKTGVNQHEAAGIAKLLKYHAHQKLYHER